MLVGDDAASAIYVRMKEKACARPTSTAGRSLPGMPPRAGIREHRGDEPGSARSWDPRPAACALHIDAGGGLLRDRARRDVDGFHPHNLGELFALNGALRGVHPARSDRADRRRGRRFRRAGVVLDGRTSSEAGGAPPARPARHAYGLPQSDSRLPAVCREADILVVAIGRRRWSRATGSSPALQSSTLARTDSKTEPYAATWTSMKRWKSWARYHRRPGSRPDDNRHALANTVKSAGGRLASASEAPLSVTELTQHISSLLEDDPSGSLLGQGELTNADPLLGASLLLAAGQGRRFHA